MTKPSEGLIHLVHEINKELLMGEAGWRMDKCAAMIEEYAKADRAAIIEECKAAILKEYNNPPKVRGTVFVIDAMCTALDGLKEARE